MKIQVALLAFLSIASISSAVNASEEDWKTFHNIQGAPDGIFASVSLRGRDFTRYAVARNFGFSMAGVGPTHPVDGIIVKIKGRAGAENCINLEHLSMIGSTNYGLDCGQGYWVMPLTYQNPTPAGGPTNLWGLTGLNKSAATTSSFGLVFSLENCGPRTKTVNVDIDSIEVTICWTLNGTFYSETKATGTVAYEDE